MRLALAAAVAGMVMAAGGTADGKKKAKADGAPPGEKEKKEEKKEQKEKDLRIDVGGRVFYHVNGYRQDGETRLTQEVTSARIEVTMRWQKWLRAVAEAELRGRLRDAYVRVRRDRLGARIGQFKPPVSAIELESAWNLPTATRGLLHDVFTDRMQIAGRRPGVQGEWNGPGRWDPQVVAGLFAPTRKDGTEIPTARVQDVNVAARASVRLGVVDLGLYGESLATDPTTTNELERWWVAGVDASLDHAWCEQGVRAWAEVMVGSTGFITTPGESTFFAARVIAAWRRWGQLEGDWYVEPYGAFEIMDPDLDITSDLIGEGAAGVNLGAWRRLRVGLETTLRFVQRNVPSSVLDPSDDVANPAFVDRTTVRLFVGAAW